MSDGLLHASDTVLAKLPGATCVAAQPRLIAAGPFAGLPQHQARVVLADPPWFFVTHSPKGWKKSAQMTDNV
jgi:hypothetical protein